MGHFELGGPLETHNISAENPKSLRATLLGCLKKGLHAQANSQEWSIRLDPSSNGVAEAASPQGGNAISQSTHTRQNQSRCGTFGEFAPFSNHLDDAARGLDRLGHTA